MDSIVALDIETTGLDPQSDAILEIGAVRFTDRRIENEFNTLLNPGRPIPPFITQLTGITDQMVRGAPTLPQVLPEIARFIGEAPILGHNVAFDTGFFRKHKLFLLNDKLDTYELASVLLPTANRYNLGALGQLLNIPLQATHRALDDAKLTRAVYLKLVEIAAQLPLRTLADLVRLGEQVDWMGYQTLFQALRLRSKETVSARQAHGGLAGPLFQGFETRNLPPLTPNSELYALNEDEVSSILEYGGAFSRAFPHYEHRPQQIEMLRTVTRAFNNSRHLMVEAGTGTGKSMAYLIPATLWALQNNLRVVISTNTINLQDQLIHKDIPDLVHALGVDVQAVVMKGRSNYFCPRRYQVFLRRGPENADEMRILGKVMVWLLQTQTGDRSELNLNGPVEREIWAKISAENEGCTTEACVKRTGGACPFYRIRQAAQSAHLLIVNHALLLADVAVQNRVLPEYDYLIIDEAHHMEDATTNALGFSTNRFAVERALHELGGPSSGILGRLLTVLHNAISPEDYASFNNLVQHASDLAFHFENLCARFFTAIEQFLFEQREGQPIGSYAQQVRIMPGTRTLPAWMDIEMAWDEAEKPLSTLIEFLEKILKGLGDVFELLDEEAEDVSGTLSSTYRRLNEILLNLNGLVFEPDPNTIYWIEIDSSGKRLGLNTAPLHIGPLMQKHLWHQKNAIIMTSATLTAAGEFNYLRGRLYAEDADELALGSPYDYESSALIYIASDIPEPGDRHGHQRAIDQGVLRLCQATGGRALVLFTSYEQLKRTSQAIGPLLARDDIRVYEQGEGASASTLLENFRTDGRAVLLGTRAFWEGVDVPGEALQVLVIVKLPFDVPSDPIIAARSETFDDPFNEYSLPEAILRFRQGFGRLIRSQSDRGIVAVLDKRILSKRYGKLFLESLPTCTTRIGPLVDIPQAAKRWLNL
jgi:DNA polymerase-3 subunit epsilon/ATP-dependent DNA helicase DinG